MARVYSENFLPKKTSLLSRDKRRLIFYILILVLPLAQFALFYIYVNFNSIIMAFQEYSGGGEAGYQTAFTFNNFKAVFDLLGERPELITNSLILFCFEVFLGLPLALIFSYYIYKKRLWSPFFRVALFLPQIISGVVFAIILKNVFGGLVITTGNPAADLLSTTAGVDTNRTVLIIFSVWMSFGVNVLLFSGAMSAINPSLVEAAELDGCNSVQEFFHVTIPSIFSTITSFVIVGVAAIFVNQMFLMHFSIGDHRLDTVGYFLYYQSKGTDFISTDPNYLSYPELSAFGLLITAVLFPVTMGIRKLFEKYGPSAR